MQDTDIDRLTAAYLSGEISAEELSHLNQILREDQRARESFLERTMLETALHEKYSGTAPILLNQASAFSVVEKSATRVWHKFAWPLTAAACGCLGFWLATWMNQPGGGSQTAAQQPSAPVEQPGALPSYPSNTGFYAGSGDPGVINDTEADVSRIWLDGLGVEHIKQGWGTPQTGKSVSKETLKVGGKVYERGIGTHAFSGAIYKLAEGSVKFFAMTGVSDHIIDDIPNGQATGCEFKVTGDGKTLWRSGVMTAGDPAKKVEVSLKGVKELRLLVEPGPGEIAYDHANWMDASFTYRGKQPVPKPWEIDHSSYILTPPAGPAPRINGAQVIGGTPGNPLIFRIPTTGTRPINFEAEDLPSGILLNRNTGILSGTVPAKGTYTITLKASNEYGKTERQLRIVSGDTLALTPPMGWNSWYCWSESISAEKVEDIAQALVDTGLADHGWTYVNIDDCWQGERGGPYNAIQGNERFPDMQALCENVHRHGLKIGIYSTPWIGTYAGFIGGSSPNPSGSMTELYLPAEKRPQPTQFFGRYPGVIKLGLNKVGEHWFCDRDARQWAEWGFDFVKYDWKPNDVPTTKRLLDDLQKVDRDIVYSLSNATPFANAKPISGMANLWRTGGDIHDSWQSILNNGFNKTEWLSHTRPGHWNDPDMLQLGKFGVPNNFVRKLKPTRLTPHEQYSHMSLWCLQSAPLLLSCDIKSMDAFALSLLSNDEVIAVNQDPLGKSATPVNGNKELWLKPLEDGSYALGIFNLGNSKRSITVDISLLGLPAGDWQARDLWRQKDLGSFGPQFTTEVDRHGVTLLRLVTK